MAVALAVFLSIVGLVDRARQGGLWPSPTPGGPGGVDADPQVRPSSDTDDTTADPAADTGRGGLWRQIRQVLLTGDSRLPSDDEPGEEDEYADEDDDPVAAGPETVDQAVARMISARHSYADTVRYLRRTYGVSESTAKRRIRVVRAKFDLP